MWEWFFLYTSINLYTSLSFISIPFFVCVCFESSIEFINLSHNLIIQNAIFQTIFRHDIWNTRLNVSQCYLFSRCPFSFCYSSTNICWKNNFSLLFRKRKKRVFKLSKNIMNPLIHNNNSNKRNIKSSIYFLFDCLNIS